jgi:hypothetical protein
MNVILNRLETGDSGTFGTLVLGGITFATGELPWRDNLANKSCIPPGTYTCTYRFSPSHNKNVYHVDNVEGRTDVEVHSGNWAGDTTLGYKSDVLGCLILGLIHEVLEGQEAVEHSVVALQQFEDALQQQPFVLTIVENYQLA